MTRTSLWAACVVALGAGSAEAQAPAGRIPLGTGATIVQTLSTPTAERESVHLVRDCLWEWRAALQSQPCAPKSVPVTVARQLLERAVQWAGQRVFSMGQSQPERRGMATTLSSLLVFSDTAVIAQVE